MEIKDQNVYKVKIEKLVFGGKSLAHLPDGKVVFVIGDVLPGENVLVQVCKSKKDFIQAKLVDRLSDSNKRIKPACKYFGKCGGCFVQSLEYSEQIKVKQEYFNEIFQKLLKKVSIEISPIIPSDLKFHYRQKLEMTFSQDKDKGLVLGFCEKGSWFKVLDIDECLLFDKRHKQILSLLKQICKQNKLSVFNTQNFQGLLRNFIIRKTFATDEWMFALVTTDEDFDLEIYKDFCEQASKLVNLKSAYHRIISPKRKKGETWIDKVVFGQEFIVEKFAGLDFRVRLADFFQNNISQAEKMVKFVVENIDDHSQKILDLFSGIGTFTLPLAKNFAKSQVFGVEIVESAVKSAEQNAKLNNIQNVNFVCQDVNKICNQVLEQDFYDIVLVDPPRAGLSFKVIKSLLKSEPKKIIYVSCNPTTLVRDLDFLVQKYSIVKIQPFDLFPQTYHIETIVVLEKK